MEYKPLYLRATLQRGAWRYSLSGDRFGTKTGSALDLLNQVCLQVKEKCGVT